MYQITTECGRKYQVENAGQLFEERKKYKDIGYPVEVFCINDPSNWIAIKGEKKQDFAVPKFRWIEVIGGECFKRLFSIPSFGKYRDTLLCWDDVISLDSSYVDYLLDNLGSERCLKEVQEALKQWKSYYGVC